MTQATNNKAGFTLVELSIVLVIIGLIIGGVLTGRQIMQNAQITNAVNAMQALQSSFQTYAQNFGALPGDDANANNRFPSLGITTPGNGDGKVQGNYDDTASTKSTTESLLAWAELRAADLLKGQGTGAFTTSQPANPFNGIYGFQYTAFSSALTANVLCVNNVPADAAQAIDTRLDDGSSNSGAIQAMISTGTQGEAMTGTVATSYVTGNTYILCMKL